MQFVMSVIMFLNSLSFISEPEKPFIIVELFTSEGCSSCPPADKLLSEIVNDQSKDVEIIGLSFHVDYWDYIGWKDPYADQAFTQRQRSYARKFHSSQIYTPQMVVNGKYEFVGSDRSKLIRVLNDLKSNTPKYKINLDQVEVTEQECRISISSKNPKTTILNVAIAERNLAQTVTRGENHGRKLNHDNVVRVFQSKQFDGELTKFSLKIPADLNLDNSTLIVYAQDETSWEVLATTNISLDQNQ